MLTDIFAERYKDRTIWNSVDSVETALLTQCFRVIAEQVMPLTFDNGKVCQEHLQIWKRIDRNLSMELGIECLNNAAFRNHSSTSANVLESSLFDEVRVDQACRSFMRAPFQADWPHFDKADRFMKIRISFVELAFREKHMQLSSKRTQSGGTTYSKRKNYVITHRDTKESIVIQRIQKLDSNEQRDRDSEEQSYAESEREINERFKRAGVPLNLHNGMVQITTDPLLEAQVATPFWVLTNDPMWTNVDIDMKEAVDRREAGERDPAFYAAKALESAIKIISKSKGLTRGNETGAAQFIDNLQSKANGRFIASWEADALKLIFSKVRNELGHGPGGEPMPSLSPQQTNWVIESSMSWTKSLIERM